MFWLEGGSNHKLLDESQLSYPLDYRGLLIKTKHFICIYITLDQNLNQNNAWILRYADFFQLIIKI